MALNTIKNKKEIDGFTVLHVNGYLPAEEWNNIPEEDKYIVVNHERNSISFRIQSAPVNEVGVNGCQVDTLIKTAQIMIKELNKKFPCWENKQAIDGLETAIIALRDRKSNRELRGVEGFNKK